MKRAPTKTLPSYAVLHELLHVDRKTGLLVWRYRPNARGSWNARFAYRAAGSPTSTGHLRVFVGNVSYMAHRIVWKMVRNEEPPPEIDHIDRNQTNNAPSNMRAATRAQNARNVAPMRGAIHRGVSWCKQTGRWKVSLRAGGKQRTLGRFTDADEAIQVYRSAAAAAYGEFA